MNLFMKLLFFLLSFLLFVILFYLALFKNIFFILIKKSNALFLSLAISYYYVK